MFVNYSDWPTKEISVNSLNLDPLNPRLPDPSPELSQRQLITQLVEHDGILKLAKNIQELGYFPSDSLVAFVDPADKKRYVLEGNRRLTALKLLLSPDAAPDAYVRQFQKLSSLVDHSALKSIHVTFAPTREDADPILHDRHTHEQIAKWKPPMQANFYYMKYANGKSIDEIAATQGTTPGKVNHFLRMHALYEVAKSLDLPDEVKEKVNDPRKFKLSALERMIEFTKVRDYLGVAFHPEKLLVGKISRKEFRKAYTKIITDIATNKVDTRVVNSEKDAMKYLAKFGDAKPDKNKGGQFAISDLIKGDEKKTTPQTITKPKKPKRRISISVIPTGVKIEIQHERVRAVFYELKKLNLDQFPNASAIMLRTLLDLCVTNYLEISGEMKPFLAIYHKKKNNPRDRSPSLRYQLNHLLDNVDIGITGQPLNAIKGFVRDRKEQLCLDSLDKFVHNKYSAPCPDDLRRIWISIDPLMEVLLVDPINT